MATASNKTYLEKQSKAWRCILIVFLSLCVCVCVWELKSQGQRRKRQCLLPGKKGGQSSHAVERKALLIPPVLVGSIPITKISFEVIWVSWASLSFRWTQTTEGTNSCYSGFLIRSWTVLCSRRRSRRRLPFNALHASFFQVFNQSVSNVFSCFSLLCLIVLRFCWTESVNALVPP